MLTNCLAECAHLTITVSRIERDIGRKSSFFIPPLDSTPPLGRFPSEHHHPVWRAKTRMAWLSGGEKISKMSLFVLAQLTNVTDRRTDRQTPGDSIQAYRAYAQHRAVKIRSAACSARHRTTISAAGIRTLKDVMRRINDFVMFVCSTLTLTETKIQRSDIGSDENILFFF